MSTDSTGLHVELDGPPDETVTRRPVLTLHGFTGSTATMWPLVRPLAETRRVAVVDLPGHGRSTITNDAHAFGFEHTVDAVAAAIDDHHLRPAHVVGYSMGGRVALSLAIRHPGHVASLSLIGASPGLSDPVERAARRRSDDEIADDLLEDGLTAFVDRWMASPLFASQVRLGTDALADARTQRLANDPGGLAGSLRGAGTGAQPSYWQDLAGIAVPALLVVGDEDPKFRAIAMRMAAGLVRSAIEVVPGAGHAAHLENPDYVRAAIGDLLDEVDSR